MTAKFAKLTALAALVAATTLSASCGEFVRDQGRSPALVVVDGLLGASGAEPERFGGTLFSDVLTLRTQPAPCTDTSPCPTIYPDLAEVAMRLISKDPGVPGIGSNPSILNSVTISRYRVSFERTDGRNQQGVDIPYTFDSAATFTVPADGTVTAHFEVVRLSAKQEAPLRALIASGNFISTIATVTFWGRDQAGNEVTVVARLGVNFGDYADPQ